VLQFPTEQKNVRAKYRLVFAICSYNFQHLLDKRKEQYQNKAIFHLKITLR